MELTPERIYNVPSLKFLVAQTIIKHTTDQSWHTKITSNDQKVKQLPTELQDYIQFMKNNQHKKSQKVTDINCQDMLDSACASGILDKGLLEDLIALDPNLNLNGTDRILTPLMWAAMMGKLSIMNLLIENGANIAHPLSSGNTPVFAIARAPNLLESHVDALQLLHEIGSPIDTPNEERYTPLLRLCMRGWHQKSIDPIQIKLIELLLGYGANINYQGNSNESAILVAARHNPILLATLLKFTPNLELVDNYGLTAFLAAAEENNFEALHLLKNAGANINYRPLPATHRNSALTNAAHRQEVGLLTKLLQLGANTEVTDPDNDTALIIAAKRNDVGTISVLLEYGANVNATDRWNHTPLLITLEKKNFPLARLLLKSTNQITPVAHFSSLIPGLGTLLETTHTDILEQMLQKGLCEIIEQSPTYYRQGLSNNATPAMKKLLTNYRSSEYKQSPWYKKLQFEVKRLAQDRPLAIITVGGVATVAIGAGLWYTLKHTENRSLPLLH